MTQSVRRSRGGTRPLKRSYSTRSGPLYPFDYLPTLPTGTTFAPARQVLPELHRRAAALPRRIAVRFPHGSRPLPAHRSQVRGFLGITTINSDKLIATPLTLSRQLPRNPPLRPHTPSHHGGSPRSPLPSPWPRNPRPQGLRPPCGRSASAGGTIGATISPRLLRPGYQGL